MKSALSPSEFALEVAKKNPSDKFMGIVAGAESGLGKTAQAFTSPVALALLPSAGISPTAQKAMGIIFGSQMVAENPDIGKQLGEEMGKNPEDRDTAKIATLLTQGFANSSLAGLMFTHAASELLPKGSENNASRIPSTEGVPEPESSAHQWVKKHHFDNKGKLPEHHHSPKHHNAHHPHSQQHLAKMRGK